MQKLILTGVALSAMTTGAWLWAGGKDCSQTVGTCSREKTSLVSTDGKTCDAKTTAVKTDGTCTAEKTSLVSTDATSCDSTKTAAAYSADKTTLVSTSSGTCDAKTTAGAGACSTDKTTLVSTDGNTCDAKTTAVKTDGACAAEKTSLVSADGKTCDAKTTAVNTDGACCGGDKAAKTSLVSLEPSEAAAAVKAIDALKPLAGKWKGETEHGTAEIEFKVGSGGSAVVETMFPGKQHEMTNVYVMDGDDLLVTHYCAAGNAPRMKMTKNENGSMTFDFHDATNLSDKSKEYMGGLVLTLDGDKLTEKWISYKDGKQSSEMQFTLERVK
jgi:hypothetical protein